MRCADWAQGCWRQLRACGLGPRLLTGFLLVALLPTIAMCGIAYVGARDEILMAEERSSLRMAQYLRSELSSLLSSYPAKLNTIASDMAVIRSSAATARRTRWRPKACNTR